MFLSIQIFIRCHGQEKNYRWEEYEQDIQNFPSAADETKGATHFNSPLVSVCAFISIIYNRYMKTKLLFSLVIGVIVVVSALWYFVYPIFRVVEVNDTLPISIQETDRSIGIAKTPPVHKVLTKNIEGSSTPYSQKEEEMELIAEISDESVEKEVDLPMTYTLDSVSLTKSAAVIPSRGHGASGSVRVVDIGSEKYIRYEDFNTIDGPGLYVYLSKDLRARDFVDLGYRKGTRGNINYKIPRGIDIDEYRYVLHWCKPFGVLFNYADLHSIDQ